MENPYPAHIFYYILKSVYHFTLIFHNNVPHEDPNLKISHYERTNEQNLAIGLTPHIDPCMDFVLVVKKFIY